MLWGEGRGQETKAKMESAKARSKERKLGSFRSRDSGVLLGSSQRAWVLPVTGMHLHLKGREVQGRLHRKNVAS